MKKILLILLLTGSSYASCSYSITHLQLKCQANELKKQEIKAIKEQTKVLEKILKEMKRR